MKSIIFTSKREFMNVFDNFSDFVGDTLRRNLGDMLDSKEIEISCEQIEPHSCMWDGEMIIKFTNIPKADEVINKIVWWSSADETSMPSKKQLRLWWD